MAKKRATKNKENALYDSEAGMLKVLEDYLKAPGHGYPFEIYKEVSTYGGYCDVVVTCEHEGEIINVAIEGKLNVNEEVCLQAENNQKQFDYSYICVPTYPNKIYQEYLKRRGIGIIVIHKHNFWYGDENGYFMRVPARHDSLIKGLPMLDHKLVSISSEAQRNPIKDRYKNTLKLHELHKTEVAGKAGGERWTQYKITVVKVQDYLAGKDWVVIEDILKDLANDMYWSNKRNGLRNMVTQYEPDKFEYKLENKKLYVRNKSTVSES